MGFSFLGPAIELREAFWLAVLISWPIAFIWLLWIAPLRVKGNILFAVTLFFAWLALCSLLSLVVDVDNWLRGLSSSENVARIGFLTGAALPWRDRLVDRFELWAQKRRRGNRDGAAPPLDEVC